MDKRVFDVAWPSILAEVSTPLLGIVDTLVVGHLQDTSALAGVALAIAILNPVLFVFNFLRMSTGGMAAQAFGAGNATELMATFVRAVCSAFAIGICLVIFKGPICSFALQVVVPPDPITEQRALEYFSTRIFGAPAVLANYAVSSWLNAVQQPKKMLAHSVVLNTSNAALCVLLAWVFGFGVAGVGTATAIANWIALIFGFALIWQVYPNLDCVRRAKSTWLVTWKEVFDLNQWWKLLSVQGNVFLRSLCLMALTTDFNALSAALGTVPLAANSLLYQFQMVLSYASDGFANAAEALVGEAVGNNRPAQIQEVLRSIARCSAILVAIFTFLFIAFGRRMLHLFTSHQDVVDYATQYLEWQWLAPALSVAAYVMDGVAVGANFFAEMRNATFAAFLCFLLLTHLGPRSNDVLWMAYLAHLVVRAAVLLFRFSAFGRPAAGHLDECREPLLHIS